MAKTDHGRWGDWRTTFRRPLRPIKRCGCGAEFLPAVDGQSECAACCGDAGALDRAKTRELPDLNAEFVASTKDEIDRLRNQRFDEIPAVAGRPARARRSKRKGKAAQRRTSGAKRVGTAKGSVEHIVRRELKAGHAPRTIAKRLNIGLAMVEEIRDTPRPRHYPPGMAVADK